RRRTSFGRLVDPGRPGPGPRLPDDFMNPLRRDRSSMRRPFPRRRSRGALWPGPQLMRRTVSLWLLASLANAGAADTPTIVAVAKMKPTTFFLSNPGRASLLPDLSIAFSFCVVDFARLSCTA